MFPPHCLEMMYNHSLTLSRYEHWSPQLATTSTFQFSSGNLVTTLETHITGVCSHNFWDIFCLYIASVLTNEAHYHTIFTWILMVLIQVFSNLYWCIYTLLLYCKNSFKNTKQVTCFSTGDSKSQVSYIKKYCTFCHWYLSTFIYE